MRRLPLLVIVGLALVAGAGVTWLVAQNPAGDDGPGPAAPVASARTDTAELATLAADAGVVEVHRAATCGCCEDHVTHLLDAGFEVAEVVHPDAGPVAALKADHGIPEALWSCHTTLVDGYAVEGHVPAEVIGALLVQRPDVDGIALPGMPAGSPGMPGDKDGPWTFRAFTAGTEDGVFAEW